MFQSKFVSKPGDNVKTLYEPAKLAGTKYNHLGSRTGLASALDGGANGMMQHNIDDEKRMWGKGYVQYTVVGDNKQPMNIDGRLFYPDANNMFTIIDANLVEFEAKREAEKRAYLESIIEKASMSDEICAMILAVPSVDDLKKILGAGQDGSHSGVQLITDPFLKEVDATPSAIETYSQDSITFSRAIQKFKIVVKAKMPILQGMTNSKVQNEA